MVEKWLNVIRKLIEIMAIPEEHPVIKASSLLISKTDLWLIL